MAVNISKVYLMDVPLEDDMRNTLYFANASAQQTYFQSKIAKSYINVSYQSDTRTFRCPDQLDTVRQYNYIMWQNPAYSNKWFYAFIKKSTYVNDKFTDVEFEVDPLQTFMFDITVKASFIEREHTNNDTVGVNTLPENIELGPYVKNSNTATPQIGATIMWYAVGVSEIVGTLSKDGTGVTPSNNINGLPNGLYYIFTDTVGKLQSIANFYDHAGKSNAIYTMFVFPKQILYIRQGNTGSWGYTSGVDWDYSDATFTGSISGLYLSTSNDLVGTISEANTITVPTTLDLSYTPRNKKLLCYPFCYFNITNNCGTSVTYRYEDFSSTPSFNPVGVFDVGCTTKLYPTNYKNMTLTTDNPYEYGITGGKYPTISWNSDSYTNWLTQNAVNIGLELGKTALSAIGSLGMANMAGVAGAGVSLFMGVTSAVAQKYEASLIPDQAKGNTNTGDLNYTAHQNKFTVFPMSIKAEYAKVADDYLDMFGYATNRVKVPYVNHRQNWWYTKTKGANIVGNVPNDELNKIKKAYDDGITYWKDPTKFLDYSQSNGIV